MLRLNSSYSKKVPADAEYSSQSYHCSVEAELPDGLTTDQIKERIHATFELCRSAVEAELQSSPAASPTPQPIAPPAPARHAGTPASPKQLAFLKTLAARRQLTPAGLNQTATERFGVASVDELSKHQASRLIDELNSARAA